MVLSRRRRSGYVIESHELDEEPALPDPLAGVVEWDATRRNMRVTFKGSELPPRHCEAIVQRAAEKQPLCLQMLCDHASPGAQLSSALAGVRLPSIKSFIFDTYSQTVTRQVRNSPGDLAVVLEAMPSLEAAFITGDVLLRPLAHASLRALFLLGDPLSARSLAGLGESNLPALTTLGLLLCSDAEPAPEKTVAAALLKVSAPRLARIEVQGVEDATALLSALAAKALPIAWQSLRIDGQIPDEDALLAVFNGRAKQLGSLKTLALPLADEVSQDAAEQGAAKLPCLRDCDDVPGMLQPSTYADW